MTVRATIDAAGTLADLSDLEARAADLTPVFEGPATTALLGMFREAFATEGQSIGERWAALSPTTVLLKARRGRARMGIGRDSDRMFRSLTVRSHPEQIREVTPNSLTLGTGVNAGGAAYPAIFHAGRDVAAIFGRVLKSPTRQPGRKLVPDELPASVRTTIEDVMTRYLATGAV